MIRALDWTLALLALIGIGAALSVSILGPIARPHHDAPISFDQAQTVELEVCGFVDGLGVGVMVPAPCPDLKYIRRPFRRYLRKFHASADEFDGATIILVAGPLTCNNKPADGCAYEDAAVVRYEGFPPMWGSFLKHELGHILAWRRHGEGDVEHERPYYP